MSLNEDVIIDEIFMLITIVIIALPVMWLLNYALTLTLNYGQAVCLCYAMRCFQSLEPKKKR